MRILLVIVNFNQIKEIANFLAQVKEKWPMIDSLVVDDGSTDGSEKVAENLGYTTVKHSRNLGIGAAIRSGVFFAHEKNYEAVLIMSSNGKMNPEEISLVTQPVQDQRCDYVTGSRFHRQGKSVGLSLFRRIAIPAFSSFSYFFFGRYFSDITCGFRCYRIDFLFQPPLKLEQDWLNRYELEYYIHYYACRMKLRIEEVPVTIRYDHLEKNRKSKIKPIVGWWSMVRPLIFLKFGLKK